MIVYVEVAKPERIVFDHVSGPKFQVTATFGEQIGKTRITFRMLFDTTAECEQIMKWRTNRTLAGSRRT